MARRRFRLGRHNQVWRFYRVSRLLFRVVWTMTHERHRVMRARAGGRYDVQPDVRALRATLREFTTTAVALGGLLIKLGQFLSARADFLPPEALMELAALQDEVPAECFADIRAAIEEDLGAPLGEIFSAIDPVPAGSASLGQVHRARLRDGREVAIKVRRPGIERIVRTDLATIRFVLGAIRRFAPAADQMMDFRGLYREFSRVVFEELDYQHEGRNAERFARLTASQPDIRVPAVIWPYTTKRVLALEWVGGIKISEIDRLDAAGVDRAALARRLMGTYFEQILQSGFFHADPHPGNIFVQPEGTGFQLVFVDFGMMGAIAGATKRALRDCFTGVVWHDTKLFVRALGDLGFLGEQARPEAIEKALDLLLDRFSSLPFGQLRNLDPFEIRDEVEALLYGQPLRLPAQFAFLGRAVAMLVGLTTALAPGFNFLEMAEPYARSLTRGGSLEGMLNLLGVESASQLGRILTREGVALARTVSSLPHLAERVLEHVERGELRLVIEGPDIHSNLSRRIVTNALSRPVPAWVPLGVAGLAAMTLLFRRRSNGG